MKKTFTLALFLGFLTLVQAQVPEIDMVFVKGGNYLMGCTTEQNQDCQVDEKPTHAIQLSDYYISKYEVTQKLWREVMGNNTSKVLGDSLPVTGISWYEARDFTIKLSKMTGQKYRLPTEAEWEYAARGGNQSRHYKFSGSDDIAEVAWFKKNSDNNLHPVGLLKPNELGLYDMSGNVYEWCLDTYTLYENATETFSFIGDGQVATKAIVNPIVDDLSSDVKVCRGGCITSFSDVCRVSARSKYTKIQQPTNVGLRLVQEVTK
ncbi:MAG: formylglycine-generating enzyme family protein [Bacteroidales bacterium]|nr:formylglycine-generating enzyme family protein [Bacteroidales bacterium]